MWNLTAGKGLHVLVILCFAGGILGGVLGSAVLKKHFRRAGMV